MVFYPYFWTLDLPHLSKRASEIPTASLAALKTQELVLHELMHAEVAGYQEPIIDIVTELPDERDLVYCGQWGECYYTHKVVVNGVRRCQKLAAQKTPPLKALKNADNYAWYATTKYFGARWGTTVSLPEGIIPGSLNPLAGSYAQPDLLYGDEAVGDAEWSSG